MGQETHATCPQLAQSWKKLEEKQAQPTAGTESKSNAALFYVDKTGVPGRRASARKRTLDRVTATDREPVAQRKSKEPRISERIKKIYKTRSKKRRKRQQRKQQARAGGAAATAVAAAESTDALAPSREESQTDDMLWCGPGDKAAAPRVGPKRRAPKPVVPDARLAESRYNRPLEAQSYNPEPQAQRDLIRQAGAVLQAEAEERARIRACIEPIPEPAPPRRGRRRADQDEYVVEDEEVPAEVVNSVVRAENRLTKRQRRRREEARKNAQEQRRRKELERANKQTIHRIKSVVRGIGRRYREQETKRVEAATKRAEDALDARKGRLGKVKYEPSFPEVLLTDDVTGILRNTEMADDAAKTVFNRLLERKLIEPRIPAKKRQRKRKRRVFKIQKDL